VSEGRRTERKPPKKNRKSARAEVDQRERRHRALLDQARRAARRSRWRTGIKATLAESTARSGYTNILVAAVMSWWSNKGDDMPAQLRLENRDFGSRRRGNLAQKKHRAPADRFWPVRQRLPVDLLAVT